MEPRETRLRTLEESFRRKKFQIVDSNLVGRSERIWQTIAPVKGLNFSGIRGMKKPSGLRGKCD